MRLLKAIVIAMAALIVVGAGVLVWSLVRQVGHGGPETTAAAPFARDLPIPQGMHLEQMTALGDRILLRLEGAPGTRILIVDPKTGQVTGTLTLVPAGP